MPWFILKLGIIIIIIKKSAKSNRVRLWKTKFNNNGNLLMNHVVAAAAGPVLVQLSFFSTLLKKFILPPSVSIFKFLLSQDSPLHSSRCSWLSRILSSQNLHSRSFFHDLLWLAFIPLMALALYLIQILECVSPIYMIHPSLSFGLLFHTTSSHIVMSTFWFSSHKVYFSQAVQLVSWKWLDALLVQENLFF